MKIFLFTLIALASTSAFAGNTSGQPLYTQITSSVNTDLDQDGLVDTAYLAKSLNSDSGYLDLWVKLSSDSTYYKLTSVVFDLSQGMAGRGTFLKLNSLGSLQVVAYNDAIGRSRWRSTATFAYRNNALVLAGYTYEGRDTLDLTSNSCDVNVLTQKGVATETTSNDSGQADFQISSKDILSLNEITFDNLAKTYLDGYCYTFDFFETE